MLDLIPIGTVNRTAAENNALKSSSRVKKAAQTEHMEADQKQKVPPPSRRFKRRQGDRRVSARGARWSKVERRKSCDRRGGELDENEEILRGGSKGKAATRKGRFIDMRA